MLQFTKVNNDLYINKQFGIRLQRVAETKSFSIKEGKTFIKNHRGKKKAFLSILIAAKYAEEILAVRGEKIPSNTPRFVGDGARNFESDNVQSNPVKVVEIETEKPRPCIAHPREMSAQDMKAISHIVNTLSQSERIYQFNHWDAYDRDFQPTTGVADPASYHFSPLGAFHYAAYQYTGYDWELLTHGDVTLERFFNELYEKEFNFMVGSMVNQCGSL